jgi:uncharacterized membrane protein YtjA (UPF0391 family)
LRAIWGRSGRFYRPNCGASGSLILAAAREFCSGWKCKFSWFPGPEPSFPDRIDQTTAAPLEPAGRTNIEIEGLDMLGWVVTFLIVALIAGILGFGGIAGASIEIAKIIFFIAVVLFLVSALIGVSRGRTRV